MEWQGDVFGTFPDSFPIMNMPLTKQHMRYGTGKLKLFSFQIKPIRCRNKYVAASNESACMCM